MKTEAISSATPASKPAISAKREFEKIIFDISRLAASAKGLAGQYLEALIAQSQSNSNKQWYAQVAGSASQILFTGLGIGLAYQNSSPEAFSMTSKVGDVVKGLMDANQSTYSMEQQKIQHSNTQWQTWANGLQDLIRNLEAGKQRLQQLEDNLHR